MHIHLWDTFPYFTVLCYKGALGTVIPVSLTVRCIQLGPLTTFQTLVQFSQNGPKIPTESSQRLYKYTDWDSQVQTQRKEIVESFMQGKLEKGNGFICKAQTVSNPVGGNVTQKYIKIHLLQTRWIKYVNKRLILPSFWCRTENRQYFKKWNKKVPGKKIWFLYTIIYTH